jgi:hypothetical protein
MIDIWFLEEANRKIEKSMRSFICEIWGSHRSDYEGHYQVRCNLDQRVSTEMLAACWVYSLTKKMEAVCSSKTLVNFYQTISHHPPSGGRLEYLHCSPVSRRRRPKGNLVPGGITWPPCHWGMGLDARLMTLLCTKKLWLQNPEKWRPDGLIHNGRDKSLKIF